jgi:hypothetical protein
MYFTQDSMLPENQEKLIITVAPFGPQWLSSDYPEDIPVSWEEQTQKAVDCYSASHQECPEGGRHHGGNLGGVEALRRPRRARLQSRRAHPRGGISSYAVSERNTEASIGAR